MAGPCLVGVSMAASCLVCVYLRLNHAYQTVQSKQD